MAGNLSNYLENKILNHVLGVELFSMPTTVYLGLFTSDPTDAGTGAEVTGGGYVRKTVTFSPAANGTTSNSADVLFPAATGAWGTVSYVAIYDAATAGNMLWHMPLSTSKTIAVTDEFKIAATKLSLSID